MKSCQIQSEKNQGCYGDLEFCGEADDDFLLDAEADLIEIIEENPGMNVNSQIGNSEPTHYEGLQISIPKTSKDAEKES